MKTYYSNGKLLISGEYLVLDGAISLALPTKYGQLLEVIEKHDNVLTWESYNADKQCWFSTSFDVITLKLINSTNVVEEHVKIATTLQAILKTARTLNSNFLQNSKGALVQTHLTFPNKWGLGTSSTLINSIANWAEVNAFELLEKSFGGSGYDIACAQNKTPITYQRNRNLPIVTKVDFYPSFRNQLFFVYLNQKQDSKEGIKMYRSLSLDKTEFIKKINTLTKKICSSKKIEEFENLLETHESLISQLLNIQPVKEKLFSNFKGAVKSLGAWGGDFVLVTGKEPYVKEYFTTKNYKTIIAYDDMILI